MRSLQQIVWVVLLVMLCIPYALLVVLSLGRGWSFPNLLPDRVDLFPWQQFFANRDGMALAFANSLAMSLIVSVTSTALGLIAGRALRNQRTFAWLWVAYLPFSISPVVIGVCMYDLQVRVGVAGTMLGVVLAQLMFAFAFATILFCEMWNPKIQRAEQLVTSLGGGTLAVWRHAILPHASRLILVCWIQTALYSWLDFGLISNLGGGNVPSITVSLFAYIREASVNQAAQSGLVLLLPPFIGFAISLALLFQSQRVRTAE